MSKANKKLQTEIQNGLKQVDEVSHITIINEHHSAQLNSVKSEKTTLIEHGIWGRKENRMG